MELSIKVDGLDRLVAAFAKLPSVVSTEIRKEMKTQLYAIGSEIRNPDVHNFTSRSNRLENAVDIKVESSGLSGEIALAKSQNVPYAYRIHEGFVGMTDRIGRTFQGPQPDQFLYKAAENRRDAFAEGMETAIGTAITKAGF